MGRKPGPQSSGGCFLEVAQRKALLAPSAHSLPAPHAHPPHPPGPGLQLPCILLWMPMRCCLHRPLSLAVAMYLPAHPRGPAFQHFFFSFPFLPSFLSPFLSFLPSSLPSFLLSLSLSLPGLNLHHSSYQSRCSNKAGSLTHVTGEFHFCTLLSHQGSC